MCLKRNLLFLIVFVCYNLQGFSQKNTIKFTLLKPLFGKTNLSYEREINQHFSAIADIQFWFLSEKERKPILESNKGIRINLELRRHINLKISDTEKIKGFLGLGGFTGRHRILMVRESYSYIFRRPSGGTRTLFAPELSGKEDLISAGIYLHWGVQLPIGKVIKLELGVLTGKAWTNQKKNPLTLFNFEPYILEEDRAIFTKDLSNNIHGLFAEPMINLGFSF